MSNIRQATYDDLAFLIRKAEQFNDVYYDRPLNIPGVHKFLEALIADENGVVLVSDNGAITGSLCIDPRWDTCTLIESGWYSEGQDGLRLLDEFEKLGYSMGADEVWMTTLEVNPGVANVLRRKGYKTIETSHRLKL